MSTKDWKNNELKTLLTERWGFSFNLLNESQEEVVEEAEEAAEDTLNEEEEEIEEGQSSSARVLTLDREQNDDRRSSNKTRPMEEGEEAGEYDDGDGKREKCDYVPCEGQEVQKKGLDEAKIRQLVRNLLEEAVKRGNK